MYKRYLWKIMEYIDGALSALILYKIGRPS